MPGLTVDGMPGELLTACQGGLHRTVRPLHFKLGGWTVEGGDPQPWYTTFVVDIHGLSLPISTGQ